MWPSSGFICIKKLQQSVFTEANDAHAAGLAIAPASPFTVDNGRSSGIFAGFNVISLAFYSESSAEYAAQFCIALFKKGKNF
jgi:hypothetical protein